MAKTNLTEMLGNVTEEAEDDLRPLTPQILVVVIMLSFFMICGIIGNALVFYIYYKKRDKTTSNVFILALAVTDFFVCLVVVPFTIISEVTYYELIYDVLCKMYLFCITSNIPLSAFIMVAIAFDRYFCICHPFLRVLTVWRSKVIILGLIALATVLGIITSLNFGVYSLEVDMSTSIENVSYSHNHSMQYEDSKNGSQSSLNTVDNERFAEVNSADGNFTDGGKQVEVLRYHGTCIPNNFIFSPSFVTQYQKVYAALFLVSVIIVFVLYALIYRSILLHRRWKSRRKRMSCYTSVNGADTMAEETQLTAINGGSDEPIRKKPVSTRQAAIRDKTLYANIKTAAMLFVVTIVFILSFLPAWLMGFGTIPMYIIVYNLYFLNNVANPFIYAFMNRAFRDDLKQLIRQCK